MPVKSIPEAATGTSTSAFAFSIAKVSVASLLRAAIFACSSAIAIGYRAGRNTQGVKIIKMTGDEKVVSAIKIDDNLL